MYLKLYIHSKVFYALHCSPFIDPCKVDPCTAVNTKCIDNRNYTRNCSCIDGYVPTTANDPENGCDCKCNIFCIVENVCL